jgi:dTDP-4-amino-4,6-dideoxygalactose transaminase
VVLVHYAGVACEMDAILEFAAAHRLLVIEDAAHAFGATWQGRPVGTLGDAGCFSLHASKHITCGEGGLLVLRDDRTAELAVILREKGTDRQAYLEGRCPSYGWLEAGSSYTLSDLLAALGTAQLCRFDELWTARRKVAGWYLERLDHPDLQLPAVSDPDASSWQLFPVQVPAERRGHVIEYLAWHGIEAMPHFPPLHLSPFARTRLPARSIDRLPSTEAVVSRLLRLPIHPLLTEEDVTEVCDRLLEALDGGVVRRPEAVADGGQQSRCSGA